MEPADVGTPVKNTTDALSLVVAVYSRGKQQPEFGLIGQFSVRETGQVHIQVAGLNGNRKGYYSHTTRTSLPAQVLEWLLDNVHFLFPTLSEQKEFNPHMYGYCEVVPVRGAGVRVHIYQHQVSVLQDIPPLNTLEGAVFLIERDWEADHDFYTWVRDEVQRRINENWTCAFGSLPRIV